MKKRTKKWKKEKNKPGRPCPIQVECPVCQKVIYVKTDKKGEHNGKIKCPYCSGKKNPDTKKWNHVKELHKPEPLTDN
jgi:predicted Zn finger-like uncharacterized protein